MSDAAYADISIDQGADFAMQIYWADSAGEPYQVIHPIRMQARSLTGQVVLDLQSVGDDEPEGTVPEITYSTASGIIQLALPAERTAELTPGKYAYDMFVTYSASVYDLNNGTELQTERRFRLVYGSLYVEGRVTKDV